MLPLPKDLTDVAQLADWIELMAIGAGDGTSSIAYLGNALEIPIGRDKKEELLPEVAIELGRRELATGDAYPFQFQHGRLIKIKANPRNYIAYIFCLYISYFGWRSKKGAKINPWLLFEDLSCVAAAEYVGGDVLKLGTSRRDEGIFSFGKAVAELCRLLGEGGGHFSRRGLQPQDDRVDLVAWRHFKDKRESKLVMFGQCAAGQNWDDKLSDLNPSAFWGLWMREAEISPLLRSFFMPHRVYDDSRWVYAAKYAGILFDRCRVAYYAYQNNAKVLADARYLAWCQKTYAAL